MRAGILSPRKYNHFTAVHLEAGFIKLAACRATYFLHRSAVVSECPRIANNDL